jgi:hypothetical protein
MAIRAAAHQGNLGKRRSKQVPADADQSSVIPEDEEMIDERPVAVNRLQFGIDCQIVFVGLATAIPHLTHLRFRALLLSIWHS